MKISTLHHIARHIHNSRRIVEKRTTHEMTEALTLAAGDATSKRQAAYLIATEVFDMDDTPFEDGGDRRHIDRILADFPGTWQPDRIPNGTCMGTADYHGKPAIWTTGMKIMHVTDDGQIYPGTVKAIADGLLEIEYPDGESGWEQPATCYPG